MFRSVNLHTTIPNGTECIIVIYTNPASVFLGEHAIRGFALNSTNNRPIVLDMITHI